MENVTVFQEIDILVYVKHFCVRKHILIRIDRERTKFSPWILTINFIVLLEVFSKAREDVSKS